eukprot:10983587-Karenia_brevis.AAC.1
MLRMRMEMYQKELGMKIGRKRRVVNRHKKIASGDRVVFIDTRNGCPGCRALRRGLAYQPRSPACRKRFEEILENEAK